MVMLTEWQIIKRRWITFVCRNIASAVTVATPSLEALRKSTEITKIDVILLFLGVLGAIAINTSSWFSTGAHKAREEITNGKGAKQNEEINP